MQKDSAIIIFVRHPELGKVKTRLAATIGDEKALKVYCFLLMHTYGLIKNSAIPVYVHYAEIIIEEDIWKGNNIVKKMQQGKDLGEKMANAFREVLRDGPSKIIIIGSDCYELTPDLIDQAFSMLDKTDTVIGPAKDGGYYLLGMTAPFKNIFQDIEWSTRTVFNNTMERIKQHHYSVSILAVLADVDTEEDITFSYE